MPDEPLALDPQTPQDSPEPRSAPAPEFASKEDFTKLLSEVAGLKDSLGKAGSRLALLDRVAEVVTGKKEDALTGDDAAVVKELRRLMPHVLPNAGALDSIPKIASTVEATAKAAAESLTQVAFGYQLELQGAAGLPVDDQKLNYHVGTAIKEWINQDKGRRDRFWRGDHAVIKEGFEEVKDLFGGSPRVAQKRAAAAALNARSSNAAPGAKGAPTGEAGPSVDFMDKKSVRAAFKAALA